jgi:hypothetical protein
MTSHDRGVPVLVLCMRWGSLYGPHYVNRLARGVARHLRRPHRFLCLTDDPGGIEAECRPIPPLGEGALGADTRWRKLALFRRDLPDLLGAGAALGGPALFLDLDLVVVDALDPFLDLPGPPVMIVRDDDLFRPKPLRRLRPARDRRLRAVGNSSVFRFGLGAHAHVLDDYLADPEGARARFEISQQFQSDRLLARGEMGYWPRGWCVSFKNDCVPRGLASYLRDPACPLGARIVVFAGSPKMDEVMAGGGHRWHRRIGDVGWLRDAWEG